MVNTAYRPPEQAPKHLKVANIRYFPRCTWGICYREAAFVSASRHAWCRRHSTATDKPIWIGPRAGAHARTVSPRFR